MTYPTTPTTWIPDGGAGFMKIGSAPHSTARVGGPIVVIPFDVVPSVANGVAATVVQATAFINSAHRVRRVYAAADAVGAATGKFNVYNGAGTPASILAAAKTIAAASTVAAADPASTGAADGPALYTLRADTTATDSSFTNLKAYLEVELLS